MEENEGAIRNKHGCCYVRRTARMRNESWHQLFSIPTVVSHESSPLERKWGHHSIDIEQGNNHLIITFNLLLELGLHTFHDFMIIHCIVCGWWFLCSLLCLSCFRGKMGTSRGNRRIIFHIYDMLVTIQWSARGLPRILEDVRMIMYNYSHICNIRRLINPRNKQTTPSKSYILCSLWNNKNGEKLGE